MEAGWTSDGSAIVPAELYGRILAALSPHDSTQGQDVLREALTPFALAADGVGTARHDSQNLGSRDLPPLALNVGHLRAARAALKGGDK